MLFLFFAARSQSTDLGTERKEYPHHTPDVPLSENRVFDSLLIDTDLDRHQLHSEKRPTRGSFLSFIWNTLFRLFEPIFRIFRRFSNIFTRSDPVHPSVAIRPLGNREELTAVQLILKGVEINVKRLSRDDHSSDESICSLLHESSIDKKIFACERTLNGFCHVRRRVFIEIVVPEANGTNDFSSEAAYTAIRLFYQRILESLLLPQAPDSVNRFIFEEFPYVRCHGMCNTFSAKYAEIMHSSASLFWEAVDAIDISRSIKQGDESFQDYVKDLAKKKNILLVNRSGEYRRVPLPQNA